MEQYISIASGIVFLVAFIPYIWSIVVRKESKPSKASWLIWAALDTITMVVMHYDGKLNGQIIGAVTGAWIIAILSLFYGQKGVEILDVVCGIGAALSVALWLSLDDPVVGVLISNLAVFIAAWPTIKNAWKHPEQEDLLAWTLYFVSCLLAVYAIPGNFWRWEWKVVDAVQPLTFLAIESIMMILLWRPRPKVLPARRRRVSDILLPLD